MQFWDALYHYPFFTPAFERELQGSLKVARIRDQLSLERGSEQLSGTRSGKFVRSIGQPWIYLAMNASET